MFKLCAVATVLGCLLVFPVDCHSHEAPHLKYSREINEAAARGEDTLGYSHEHHHDHGHHHDHDHDHHHDHEHGHHHDHDHDHHHEHVHDEHVHAHHDHDHIHDHLHDHHDAHHAHSHEHGGGCPHAHIHGHEHGHEQHVQKKRELGANDYVFDKAGPLAFLNDPQQRLWYFSIASTVLISLFPCFILTFIPINANTEENSPKLKALLALGAGGLLGDAFLHLIPHAQLAHEGHGHSHSHAHSHAPGQPHEPHDLSVGGWVLGGFLIFFLVEKFVRILRGDSGHGHSHGPAKKPTQKKSGKKEKAKKSDDEGSDHDEPDDNAEHEKHRLDLEAARLQIAAYLNLIADFMHNFTDGLAIGASFIAGEKVGIVTMVTVLIHEIPHEIGDFAILVQSGYSKRKAMLIQLLTALGALAGCVISCLSSDPNALAEQAQSSWVLPFTAGGFIYVASVSVIPELLEKSSFLLSLAEVLFMGVGVFAMYLIALYE